MEIDFTDDSSEQLIEAEVENYSGEKGRTDRIALMYKRIPYDKPDPKIEKAIQEGDYDLIERNGKKFVCKPWIIGAKTHFIDKFGMIECMSTANKTEFCCEKLGDPRTYFMAMVVHYYTDKDGKPKKPFGYDLKFWRFSEQKFKSLKRKQSLDASRKLVRSDLLISCEDDKYQKMDFDVVGQSFWRMKPEVEDEIYNEASKLAAQFEKALTRKATVNQIKEKLGMPVEIDFDSAKNVTAENFDDLIEDPPF